MNLRAIVCTGVGLLLTGAALAEPEPKSILWEESGPFKHVDGTGKQRNSQTKLLHHRNRANAEAAAKATSQDIGDVAVIVDNGAIIVQPKAANPFDFGAPSGIQFVPDGTDGFAVSATAGGLDPDVGSDLGLSDDSTTEVVLGFDFPFLGGSYESIWVNSDGNITLGEGDDAFTTRDAARHIGGAPRISAFFNDLNVDAGGAITADVRTDSVVVTWTAVPEFGVANANTFQVSLDESGNIAFSYGDVDASFAIVGVAEGGDEGPINEVDLSTDLPATLEAGAIFEEFNPEITGGQVDIVALAKEFYKTHDDKYDFLVLFTDFVPNLGGAFAFLAPVKNETLGLGGAYGFGGIQDNSADYGSAGELEAFVMMNRIGLYWPDANKLVNPPIKKFRFSGSVPGATLDGPPGKNQSSRRSRWFGTLQGDFGGARGSFTLGMNSAMSLMAQEAGHRWLAYPLFLHPTKGLDFGLFGGVGENTDLMGRQLAHWSFFFNAEVPPSQFGGDPRASGLEGNVIRDLGPGASAGLPVPCDAAVGESTFLTDPNELTDGFTELDQYFMGVRSAADVSTFWYVDEPRSAFSGNSLDSGNPQTGLSAVSAQDDIIFCGKRVNLEVADIQAIGNIFGFPPNGPRVPEFGDEVDAVVDGEPVDVKTMAFILLFEDEGNIRQSTVEQVQTFLETWKAYANGPATGGRGKFDTSLNPVIH